MTVRDLAELDVKSCSPDADLASAAKIMWTVIAALFRLSMSMGRSSGCSPIATSASQRRRARPHR